MKTSCIAVAVLLFLASGWGLDATPTQVAYFPQGVFVGDNPRLDSALAKWLSEHLTALSEPSIFSASHDQQVHTYRFLWLRTWDKPVSVRIERRVDGTGTLTLKVGTGSAGFKPGILKTSRTKQITAAEFDAVVAQFKSSEFWTAPTRAGGRGADGAGWIFEGLNEGQYHIVDRWSPKDGPFREMGLRLLKLANFDVSNADIY